MERALWLAIRSLDERARLTTRLSDDALDRGRRVSAAHFRAAADDAWQTADQIRKVVNGLQATGTEFNDPAGSGDSGDSGGSGGSGASGASGDSGGSGGSGESVPSGDSVPIE